MQAGKLRHRVTIETPTKSQATTGSITYTWDTYATVWAAIEPLTGREFFAAAQVQSNVSTKIRVRNYDGITPKMRVVHGDDYYDIQAVLPDPTGKREIHLMCVKRGQEGFRNG